MMEASEFEARKQELMEECTITPEVFVRLMPRLERFMVPFVGRLARKEQIEHARTFVRGLLSDLEHKNAESIAYLFGQERMPLQHFLGVSCWDDKPLRDELVSQVGKQLGEVDGVIVFDPSAFPKSGCDSVGVARQWCGRLGKVDNCQVGIFINVPLNCLILLWRRSRIVPTILSRKSERRPVCRGCPRIDRGCEKWFWFVKIEVARRAAQRCVYSAGVRASSIRFKVRYA